jgi:hypothetical protein
MEILVVAYSDQEVPDLIISQVHTFKHHCNDFNYDSGVTCHGTKAFFPYFLPFRLYVGVITLLASSAMVLLFIACYFCLSLFNDIFLDIYRLPIC